MDPDNEPLIFFYNSSFYIFVLFNFYLFCTLKMIYAIVGLPGTGKSYYAVSLVRKFLSEGIDVYVNIPIDESKFGFGKIKNKGTLYYWKSTAQFRFVQNGIVIIDEAASYFEARNWLRFSPDDRIKFQQHRKQKLDIYVLTQSFSRIESSIRQLVNFIFEMKNIKIFKWLLFIASQYIPEDIDLKTRKPLNRKYFFLHKKIADAYDTYDTINLLHPPVENRFKKMSELFEKKVSTGEA